MMKSTRKLFALAFLASGVWPAWAQSVPDARATDATQLFEAFCIGDLGSRDRALAVLGDGNEIASRLPEDLVTALQGGQLGGVAWAIAGPNQSQLLLGYAGNGICEVRVADADETSLKSAFEGLANSSARHAGAKLASEPATTREQAGAKLTYQAFSYPYAGKTAHLAITTSDKRVGSEQHLMTFALAQ